MRFVPLRIVWVLVLVLVIAAAATAQQKGAGTTSPSTASKAAPSKAASAKAAPSKGPRTIIGEVVDPACWVINGAKGEGHKECVIACAKAGQTLAILERKTNKIYILASERPGEDPNKGLIDYAGQSVLVKGKVYTRSGLMAIQVASIEPYSAARAAP